MFEAVTNFAVGTLGHVAEWFGGMFDSKPAAPHQPQELKPTALPPPKPELMLNPMVRSVRKAEPERSLADELLAEARQQAKEDLRELLQDYENPHEMERRRKRGPGVD